MAVTTADIVNQALLYMGGNQAPVSGNWPNFVETGDAKAAAQAANKLYGACVATVGRQFEWDFARFTDALELSGNTAPYPWTLEYVFPAEAIQVWQVFPSEEDDPFDPLPVNFTVANAVVDGNQVRVIHTDLADAMAVYNNNPNPNTFDAGFREALVRLLASELAIAIGGKPDTSSVLLQSATAMEGAAIQRQD